jgi:hypothetical protein
VPFENDAAGRLLARHLERLQAFDLTPQPIPLAL